MEAHPLYYFLRTGNDIGRIFLFFPFFAALYILAALPIYRKLLLANAGRASSEIKIVSGICISLGNRNQGDSVAEPCDKLF